MQFAAHTAVQKPLVLFVDQHAHSASGLITSLEYEGYDVAFAEDGAVALQLTDRMSPRLILMDLNLPVLDGLAVIRKLRADGSNVPVIVLTDRVDEASCVAALRVGADDFVGKPFSLLELFERIKIQLRKMLLLPVAAKEHEIRIGDALIDLAARVVKKASASLPLRPKEFDLLNALLRAEGQVVTKEELLSGVWGWKCRVETRTLDFHVATLREKIEIDPPHPRHLLTARGVGYRLVR